MSAELHVSEPEMKNVYMHLCVRIKSSEQTQRSMLLKIQFISQLAAKIVGLMRGLGKREG